MPASDHSDAACGGKECPVRRVDRPPVPIAARTPSVFRAIRQPEATLQCFGLGGIDELPTPGRDHSIFNANAGGLVAAPQTISGFCAPLPYDRCPPRTPNVTPSRFTCDSVNCAASQCYDEGWINTLPQARVIARPRQNCCQRCQPCGGRSQCRPVTAYRFGVHDPPEPYN